jgi:peptidoglycan/LPS O-acetylase OafA/YrhL
VALYPIFYYCLTEEQSPLVQFLNWKPVRQIGLISYSLYLCHLAILVKMRLVLPHHLVIAALIALVLSIGYAWSMRLIVERPLRVFRDSLGGRNKISAVADATQSV